MSMKDGVLATRTSRAARPKPKKAPAGNGQTNGASNGKVVAAPSRTTTMMNAAVPVTEWDRLSGKVALAVIHMWRSRASGGAADGPGPRSA
jgi:hypothetical protein